LYMAFVAASVAPGSGNDWDDGGGERRAREAAFAASKEYRTERAGFSLAA